jgi:hypothetical protein
MAQGVPLSDEQILVIREVWIATGNGSAAARACGCSARAANAYIAEQRDELLQLRQHKKGTTHLADAFREAALSLLAAALGSDKVGAASTKDLIISAATALDKAQLLSGLPTNRTENVGADPRAVLTPEEREQAARIRAKLAAST